MTPATNRIEITLSDDKLAALDDARGREPRASFIKHALDVALSASETPDTREAYGKHLGEAVEQVRALPATEQRAQDLRPLPAALHRPTCKCPVCRPKGKR